jgi:hypothetical protein
VWLGTHFESVNISICLSYLLSEENIQNVPLPSARGLDRSSLVDFWLSLRLQSRVHIETLGKWKVIGSFVVSWIWSFRLFHLPIHQLPRSISPRPETLASPGGDHFISFRSRFHWPDETADETLTVRPAGIESPGKRLRAGR